MRKHLKKIRKSIVTKEEIIADAVFLFIPALVSFLIVFFFDVHHSFYEWPMTLKFIFNSPYPYVLFVTIGTILGFFMIKLLLFGIREEEKI
jgi:lysylphosphatidylglycerol synthetase-like protein (DUF2156 family)